MEPPNSPDDEPVDNSNDIRNLKECIDADGNVDAMSLLFYRRKKRKERDKQFDSMLTKAAAAIASASKVSETKDKSQQQTPQAAPRTRTCFKQAIMQMRLPGGNLIEMTPQLSPWYTSYVTNPQVGITKFEKKFRLRFGCTYEIYLTLLNNIKSSDKFARWYQKDAVERPASPIELLVLGALRYIGRGWTFDDAEESTGISEECHRQFFHIFIEWGKSLDFLKNDGGLATKNITTAAEEGSNPLLAAVKLDDDDDDDKYKDYYASIETTNAAGETIYTTPGVNSNKKKSKSSRTRSKSSSTKAAAGATNAITIANTTITNNDNRKSFKAALDSLMPTKAQIKAKAVTATPKIKTHEENTKSFEEALKALTPRSNKKHKKNVSFF